MLSYVNTFNANLANMGAQIFTVKNFSEKSFNTPTLNNNKLAMKIIKEVTRIWASPVHE